MREPEVEEELGTANDEGRCLGILYWSRIFWLTIRLVVPDEDRGGEQKGVVREALQR